MNHCPLCASKHTRQYSTDNRRDYAQCERCALVFVAQQFHLPVQQEKAEYDKHQNSPDDAGYRRFLGRIITPLAERLQAGDRVLDFGCGPGPAIAAMLASKGVAVDLYDPFYHNDKSLLAGQYHAVVATEVIEHLRQPAETLAAAWQCVLPGGVFAVMSKLVIDANAFTQWHYKNDPTHICFYSETTLHWLAKCWNANLQFFAKDAFMFFKGEGSD